MKKLILQIADPDRLDILENTLIPSIPADEVKKVYHASLINLGLTKAVHHLAQAIEAAMIGDDVNKELCLVKAVNQIVTKPCMDNLLRVAALVKTLSLNSEIDGAEDTLLN